MAFKEWCRGICGCCSSWLGRGCCEISCTYRYPSIIFFSLVILESSAITLTGRGVFALLIGISGIMISVEGFYGASKSDKNTVRKSIYSVLFYGLFSGALGVVNYFLTDTYCGTAPNEDLEFCMDSSELYAVLQISFGFGCVPPCSIFVCLFYRFLERHDARFGYRRRNMSFWPGFAIDGDRRSGHRRRNRAFSVSEKPSTGSDEMLHSMDMEGRARRHSLLAERGDPSHYLAVASGASFPNSPRSETVADTRLTSASMSVRASPGFQAHSASHSRLDELVAGSLRGVDPRMRSTSADQSGESVNGGPGGMNGGAAYAGGRVGRQRTAGSGSYAAAVSRSSSEGILL